MSRNRSAPGDFAQQLAVLLQGVTLRHLERAKADKCCRRSAVVLRMTTWPLNGSCWLIQSTRVELVRLDTHATSAPWARFVAITSAAAPDRAVRSMAAIRSITVETSMPLSFAISPIGSGNSLQKHGELLCKITGAERFLLMPAKRLFALGVGHVRRRGMEPGSKSDELPT